jgi:hypothetical protein
VLIKINEEFMIFNKYLLGFIKIGLLYEAYITRPKGDFFKQEKNSNVDSQYFATKLPQVSYPECPRDEYEALEGSCINKSDKLGFTSRDANWHEKSVYNLLTRFERKLTALDLRFADPEYNNDGSFKTLYNIDGVKIQWAHAKILEEFKVPFLRSEYLCTTINIDDRKANLFVSEDINMKDFISLDKLEKSGDETPYYHNFINKYYKEIVKLNFLGIVDLHLQNIYANPKKGEESIMIFDYNGRATIPFMGLDSVQRFLHNDFREFLDYIRGEDYSKKLHQIFNDINLSVEEQKIFKATIADVDKLISDIVSNPEFELESGKKKIKEFYNKFSVSEIIFADARKIKIDEEGYVKAVKFQERYLINNHTVSSCNKDSLLTREEVRKGKSPDFFR